MTTNIANRVAYFQQQMDLAATTTKKDARIPEFAQRFELDVRRGKFEIQYQEVHVPNDQFISNCFYRQINLLSGLDLGGLALDKYSFYLEGFIDIEDDPEGIAVIPAFFGRPW